MVSQSHAKNKSIQRDYVVFPNHVVHGINTLVYVTTTSRFAELMHKEIAKWPKMSCQLLGANSFKNLININDIFLLQILIQVPCKQWERYHLFQGSFSIVNIEIDCCSPEEGRNVGWYRSHCSLFPRIAIPLPLTSSTGPHFLLGHYFHWSYQQELQL